MKISLICTVFNEAGTIKNFLDSILIQTKKPYELVIVDGTSTDGTVDEILDFQKINKNKLKIKLIEKKGNRSVGRNAAIKNATCEIILCSDAGCILDKTWVENIVKPFFEKDVDVVAGYYEGRAKNVFEKSLIPYVLVMSDRLNPQNFLPATRSMAFKKSIWEKAGKFDEKLSNNEDYAFAKKLKKIGAKILFEKKAVVYWIPRKNFRETFNMFYRFALGDSESGILRPKVLFLFLRYLIGIILICAFISTGDRLLLFFILILILGYVFWAILKNYKYVKNPKALFYLPALQFCSDFAVILGTSLGFVKSKV